MKSRLAVAAKCVGIVLIVATSIELPMKLLVIVGRDWRAAVSIALHEGMESMARVALGMGLILIAQLVDRFDSELAERNSEE
jgi:hypothetical protein